MKGACPASSQPNVSLCTDLAGITTVDVALLDVHNRERLSDFGRRLNLSLTKETVGRTVIVNRHSCQESSES
jgi:hypothetical protein